MGLFNFGKKKKEGCSCHSAQAHATRACEDRYELRDVTNVKVLGSGCKSCHALYENAQNAMKEMESPVEVEYITDMEKVATYGVMSMPALVINDEVASTGKVLSSEEIKDFFKGKCRMKQTDVSDHENGHGCCSGHHHEEGHGCCHK